MADVYLKKSPINRSRTIGSVAASQATVSAGDSVTISANDTESATNPFVIRWYPERIDLIGLKKLIEIQLPRSKNQFSTKDPENRVYDWKRLRNIFRITGKLTGISWNDVAKKLHFMQIIFEDGGALEFKWHDDTYNVNVINYQFWNEKKSGIWTIYFRIDLTKADTGTGI